jgi:MoxR-like ATPase
VVPEDVQALFIAVAGHRLVAEAESSSGPTLARAILHSVKVD